MEIHAHGLGITAHLHKFELFIIFVNGFSYNISYFYHYIFQSSFLSRCSKLRRTNYGSNTTIQNMIDKEITCMQNSSLLQKFQCQQHLLRVTSDRLNVYPTVLSVLLEYLPEVHRQRFHYHAQVSFVEKVTEQTKAMELIFGVCIVQAFEDLQLPKAGLVPVVRKFSIFYQMFYQFYFVKSIFRPSLKYYILRYRICIY